MTVSVPTMLTKTFISPLTYIVLLLAIYGSTFLGSPLSWFNYAYIDARYFGIFATYCASLMIGYWFLGAFIRRPKIQIEIEIGTFEKRAIVLFWIVMVFCILRLIALREIPLLGNLGARYNVDLSLGGFIDYTCTLANPLAIYFLCAGIKNRSSANIRRYLALLFIQLLFFKRLDLFVLIFGSAISAVYYRKVSFGTFLTAIAIGIPLIYTLLGLGAILRAGGADNISRVVSFWELPFWVIIGDLNGAIKFGHYIADGFGAGGMNMNYTFGVFSAIAGSDSSHSAGLLMNYVEGATTAQSINAPISYYVDGGYPYLVGLGLLQGGLWCFFRNGFKDQNFSAIASVLIFLQALWTIRSGELLFPPSRIYELAMLLALFYIPSTNQIVQGAQQLTRLGFYGALSVTCLFLAIRLPSTL